MNFCIHDPPPGLGDDLGAFWLPIETDCWDYLAEIVVRHKWVPSDCVGGIRSIATTTQVRLLPLDFDKGTTTLAGAVERFKGYRHIIGTTKSHQLPKGSDPPCDRFRVILLAEAPITSNADFKATIRAVAGDVHFDPRACNIAQFMRPCKKIISVSEIGMLVPVVHAPDLRRKATPIRAGKVTEFARRKLVCMVPEGERNSTFWQVSKDLFRAGFDRDQIAEAIFGCVTYRVCKPGRKQIDEIDKLIKSAEKSVAVDLALAPGGESGADQATNRESNEDRINTISSGPSQ